MVSRELHGVVLVLGPAGALSGGDMHALRLAQLWHETQPTVAVVGPPDLVRFLGQGHDALLIPLKTPFDRYMRTSAVALAAGFLWRGFRSVPHLRRATVIVAGSHLIFDVLPAAIAHFLFRKPVATYVYHVIGDINRPPTIRSRLAVMLERVSIGLIRLIGAIVFIDNPDARSALIVRGVAEANLRPTAQAYDPVFPVLDPAPAEPARLLFVGRLVAQKGIWDVIDIARRLVATDSPIQIDVVGDGPLKESLVKVIEVEGLTNIHLLGFVDERTKWRLLSESALFLAPSREEGWGIAVGEALLAGLPVVALDLPAYDHFPHQLVRARQDGSDFVELTLSVAVDPVVLAELSEASRAARRELPSWAEILLGDIRVLNELGDVGG